MKHIIFLGLFLIDVAFVACQSSTSAFNASTQGAASTSISTQNPNVTSVATTAATSNATTAATSNATTAATSVITTAGTSAVTSGITTTQSPTTYPPSTADATVNTYKYSQKDSPCLIVSMKAYFNKSGLIVNVTKNFTILPSESACGRAVVTFQDTNFTLHFKNDSQKLYWLYQVDAYIGAFGKAVYSKANLTIGKSKLKASYKCNKGFMVNLTKTVVMVATDVQFQAFEITGGKFGTAQICSADIGNDIIIPIAVGCALAGLIILVLIAYMIGRKQVKHRYEAM